MKTGQQILGTQGEDLVAEYLRYHGFKILARNYHSSSGEVDLIACKGDILTFVEVKTRSYHLVEPAALVPLAKQQRIIRSAYAFIAQQALEDKIYRFDIAFLQSVHGTLTIDYVENAFTDSYG